MVTSSLDTQPLSLVAFIVYCWVESAIPLVTGQVKQLREPEGIHKYETTFPP